MRARLNHWGRTRLLVVVSVLAGTALAAACGDDSTGPMDTGPSDATPPPRDSGSDSGMADTGPRDAGPNDTGPGDTGPGDTGPGDTGPGDAGPGDAGMDAGPPDAGPEDGGPLNVLRYDGSTAPVVTPEGTNLAAVHNPMSTRYDGHCLGCHPDVLARTTLDPAIEQIHPRMIPWVPTYGGVVDDEDCIFCHASVDFSENRSAGNLRRQVAMSTCYACHRAGTFDFYLP